MGFLKSLNWKLAMVLCLVGRPYGGDPDAPDAYDRGTIHISADESFKPVLDAQVQVYEATYPDTRILIDYKPEAECLKDVFSDSVRMIITTRIFKEAELQAINDSLKLVPHQKSHCIRCHCRGGEQTGCRFVFYFNRVERPGWW